MIETSATPTQADAPVAATEPVRVLLIEDNRGDARLNDVLSASIRKHRSRADGLDSAIGHLVDARKSGAISADGNGAAVLEKSVSRMSAVIDGIRETEGPP